MYCMMDIIKFNRKFNVYNVVIKCCDVVNQFQYNIFGIYCCNYFVNYYYKYCVMDVNILFVWCYVEVDLEE